MDADLGLLAIAVHFTVVDLASGRHPAEREGFEPSDEVSPVTRFPVAPVQPLRHLSGAQRSGRLRDAIISRSQSGLRSAMLAISRALVETFGLIATFIGIGVI